MKQVITITQAEIEEAIRAHLEKHVTGAYGKEIAIESVHFEFKEEELICELGTTIKQKEGKS